MSHCFRILGDDHINGCPVSKKVWHSKEPSLLNGHECQAWVKICSPSPVMVKSAYERKILERIEKPQTKNPTKLKYMYHELQPLQSSNHQIRDQNCHEQWRSFRLTVVPFYVPYIKFPSVHWDVKIMKYMTKDTLRGFVGLFDFFLNFHYYIKIVLFRHL